MFDEACNYGYGVGFLGNPARTTFAGYGYDRTNYIATARLAPSAYTDQQSIIGRLGGLNRLTEACDDSVPPTGSLLPTLPGSNIPNPAYVTYLSIIQNVVTEINGYISSVYPIPLAQTGTVAVFKITETDSSGGVTDTELIENGNYKTAPIVAGSNLIPTGSLYPGNLNFNVTVVAGSVYQIIFGANDAEAVDSPLSNPVEILNPGTGVPFLYVATSAVIRFIGSEAAASVTASIALSVANAPAYLRHFDPMANVTCFGSDWQTCQTGTGLSICASFVNQDYSDESGQVLQAKTVTGDILILNAGTGYNVGDLMVFTGGASFVPAKIRQATLELICHSLYQRRLAPEEKNIFADSATFWRDYLKEIGDDEKPLDGTYKRFYSAGAAWGSQSVLNGANSL